VHCRLLCFKCLNLLVTSTLVRNKAAASSPQVVAWLDKVVKAVLSNARKGGISAKEQQVRRAPGVACAWAASKGMGVACIAGNCPCA
jgi:hypothetical protein